MDVERLFQLICLMGFIVIFSFVYFDKYILTNHRSQISWQPQIYSKEVAAPVITNLTGIELCPSNISKPNLDKETFEFQNVTDRKVLVFSAYYETRINASGPAIRIIATGWQRAYREVGDIYCTLWYESRREGISVGPADYHTIYHSTAHHEMWCAHFILCPLPKVLAEVPFAVSVTHAPCAPFQNVLYINNRGVVEKKGKHAVCYPVLHGRFKNWTLLVEFFEFQRLLGAEEITIYSHSVHAEVSKTLQYFKNIGWLTVIPYHVPEIVSSYFTQRVIINECIYRHMHRYDYVSVVDIDEIFIPKLATNWYDLLDTIGKPEYGAYLFQHFYFRRNSTKALPSDHTHLNKSMITLSSIYRTDVATPAGKVRCKSMYKADKVVKADIHFPYELVPGAEEYLMDPREAVLHHYRPSPMGSFINHPERYTFIEDRYVEIYSESLQMKYKEHLKNLLRT